MMIDSRWTPTLRSILWASPSTAGEAVPSEALPGMPIMVRLFGSCFVDWLRQQSP
jgi:hypothetical protein